MTESARDTLEPIEQLIIVCIYKHQGFGHGSHPGFCPTCLVARRRLDDAVARVARMIGRVAELLVPRVTRRQQDDFVATLRNCEKLLLDHSPDHLEDKRAAAAREIERLRHASPAPMLLTTPEGTVVRATPKDGGE